MDDSGDGMILAPTLAALGDDPRRALDRVHDAGFRAVQLSATQPGLRPRELDGSARRDLSAVLRRSGLAAAGIDIWLPIEHFHDPAHADRAVSAVLGATELAADLGRCPVSLSLPRPAPDGHTAGPNVGELIESIAAHAERFGVPLADHGDPMLNCPGVGVGIDPPSILARGENPEVIVARVGEQIVSARLCDLLRTGMRGPVGDATHGRLDVAAYQASLSVVGYRRPVIADARQWADPWAGLELSRKTWEKGDRFIF